MSVECPRNHGFVGSSSTRPVGKNYRAPPWPGGSYAPWLPHGPHRFIGPDLQNPLQRQHGGTAFLSSHQEDHPEPFPQGRPGLMKNRSGRHRSLVTTGLAGIYLQAYK